MGKNQRIFTKNKIKSLLKNYWPVGIIIFICFIYFSGINIDEYDRKIKDCSGLDSKENILGAEFGCKLNVAKELSKTNYDRALKICLEASPLNDGSYYSTTISTSFCNSELKRVSSEKE